MIQIQNNKNRMPEKQKRQSTLAAFTTSLTLCSYANDKKINKKRRTS